MFPFGPPDPPDQPGPVRHIAYVLATNSTPKVPMLLLAYTSSGPWRGAGGRLPLGVMELEAAAARTVGQKPFHLDLRCLAQVPLTRRWFPDLERPGHGIVGTASTRLQQRIDALLSELVARNRHLIEIRGPR
jgi:hypothetical protein